MVLVKISKPSTLGKVHVIVKTEDNVEYSESITVDDSVSNTEGCLLGLVHLLRSMDCLPCGCTIRLEVGDMYASKVLSRVFSSSVVKDDMSSALANHLVGCIKELTVIKDVLIRVN